MLYIVATPIGNLSDITLRALETLRKVDLILAEDTRQTIKLLNHYQIKKPLFSFHSYTNERKLDQIKTKLKAGRIVALVTDSGTPGISDPGAKLVQAIIKDKGGDQIKILPIPGPSALTAAVSVSGFSVSKFLFLGFLPRKKGRKKLLESLNNEKRTVVFYESPFRVKKTLAELSIILGDKEVCVCRELTKIFETIYRGRISEVLPKIKEKGEFVVLIAY